MRKRESGFTLIELLTVIAIIAILAAILLPVLSSARERGRRTTCMSNLHQIAAAVQMYRDDNRQFPLDALEASAILATHWYGTNDQSGDGWGLGGLYPEYVTQKKPFNCPNSDVSDVNDPKYNTYDGQDPAKVGTPDEIKYRRAWKVNSGVVDPSERRQLYWRNPPMTTIVSWCHLHRANPEAAALRAQDKDLLVALDGHAEQIPSQLTSHAYNE